MSIQTLKDTGSSYDILSNYDAAVYRLASDDCVLKGIGDEFTLNYSINSLNVSFYQGSQAVLCGNFFRITGNETIELPANSTIYLCARIDTSKPNGTRGSFETLTSVQMTSGNINGNDTTRDLLLYIITTDSNGVVSVEDKRIIKDTGGSNIIKKTLLEGETTITFNGNITTNSILSFFTSIYGVSPESVNVGSGYVELTFSAQESDMIVGVKVEGTY